MWNRIDLDSDYFFQDAQYEAFIDPVQHQRNQEEFIPVAGAATEDPESSEGIHSDQGIDRGSPMAVGSDDRKIR